MGIDALRKIQIRSAWQALEQNTDELIDYGVRLYTVRQDLEAGAKVVPGAPPLSPIGKPHDFGGIWDVGARKFIGPSKAPLVWFAGEEATELLLDESNEQTRILHTSAEGGGKSVNAAMWVLLWAIRYAERGHFGFMGGTAPTRERRKVLLDSIRGRAPIDSIHEPIPGAWGRFYTADQEIRLHLGITIQLRATKRQSKASGSPIQGWTWMAAVSDEMQDQIEADGDIESRLRGGPDGISRRYCTATAKDESAWRDFYEERRNQERWRHAQTAYNANPFIDQSHWDTMQASMSWRDWQRRGLGINVGSELQTYEDFDRNVHCRPLPQVARDVSHHVLGLFSSYTRPGATFKLLAAHDPGVLQNTTVLLRPYLVPKSAEYERHVAWWIVGEFVTKKTTQDQHAKQFADYVRDEFGLNQKPDRMDPSVGLERVLVLNDPHSRGEKRPDEDEYMSFRRHGLDIFSASAEGNIKRRTRIEMVRRLHKNAKGLIRLFIATDDYGECKAPETLKSFETQQREPTGEAERVKKNIHDTTHASVATGYGLWPFEREAFSEFTLQCAIRGAASWG